MDRNITVIGLVLTPSENQQFSMSFRTIPGTIMVVWPLGAKSSASTWRLPVFHALGRYRGSGTYCTQQGWWDLTHTDCLQFGACHFREDMDQSQGRAEEKIEGKHLRTCKERWRELFKKEKAEVKHG